MDMPSFHDAKTFPPPYYRQTHSIEDVLGPAGLAKPQFVAKHNLPVGEVAPPEWTDGMISVV
jgi:hypothetical protein